jgi:hypothetical protein
MANKKEGHSIATFTEEDIKDYRNEMGYLYGDVKDARKYINLIKIHYERFPDSWKTVLRKD